MHRYLAISAAFLLLLCGMVQAQSKDKTFKIEGRVLDIETNGPLPGVNVFLDNTLKGSSTDKNGNFEISNLKPGNYLLVASMIGYKIIKKTISIPEVSSKKFLIGLTPDVQKLPNVLVKADRPRTWYRNLDRFKESFLGYTENGSETEIVNTSILRFQNKDNRLIATTRDNPLVLENRSLGYKVEFYLRSMTIGKYTLDTFGFTNYTELVPEDGKEFIKWREQRRKTYLGSFRHFIQALANDDLEQEGFKVFYAETREDIFDDCIIRANVRSESAKGKISDHSEILVPNVSQEQLQLINTKSKYLGVIYTREPPERRVESAMNAKLDYQVSLIELPADTASLEVSSGNYHSPYRPVLHGYWSFTNRLPDLLPDDFETSRFYRKEKIKDRISLLERAAAWNPENDIKVFPDSLTNQLNNPFSLSTSISPVMDLSTLAADKVRISPEQSWKMGEALIQNGSYTLALNLWNDIDKSFQQYQIEETDPRIGFRYIEIATDRGNRDKYRKASELYHWGLTNVSGSKYKDVLTKEMERLEPITEKEIRKKWNLLLEEGRFNELGKSIKTFWEMKDPTLATDFNERLLEHWERLAFVKNRFNRNKSWVYGTDDRAKIYVAYGAPDFMRNTQRRSKDGILANTGSFNRTSTSREVGTYTGSGNITSINREVGNTFGFSSQSSKSSSGVTSNTESIKQPVKELGEVLHFLYDVWSYSKISPEFNQDIIFLFGNDGDTKEYRLLDSVEEMIPSKYFRPICAFNQPCNPIPLQKSLYFPLTTEHSFFSQFYNQLERQESNENTPALVGAKIVRSRSKATLANNRMQAPSEHSQYETELLDIPVNVYQYRLLNYNNEPVLATFIKSRPHQSLFIDQLEQKNFDRSNYYVLHSYVLSGKDETNSYISSNVTNLTEDYGRADQMQPSDSYAEIPNISEGTIQVFTSELRNKSRSASELSENLFPEQIRGIGKYRITQPEPLSTNKSSLEVSDLIIGYANGPENSKETFGFKVTPDGKIPNGNDIVIHFEVYHLKPIKNRTAKFRINYLLKPTEGFLGNLFKDQETVTLTLNFETSENRYKDNLEIDTSDLEAGQYSLTFGVTEAGSGRKIMREITFEIVE